MANNCLVTKLKGVVDNNKLPVINTLYLDLLPGMPIGGDVMLVLTTGEKTVTVTASHQMSRSVTPYNLVTITNEVVPVYTIYTLYVKQEDIGSNGVQKLIKIEGDGIYDFTALVCNYQNLLGMSEKYCSLSSVKYMNNLLKFGVSDYSFDIVPDSVKLLISQAKNMIDINPLVSKNVQEIQEGTITGMSKATVSIDNRSKNISSLLVFNIVIEGNVANLPYNTKVLGTPTSGTQGNLEDFVASARSFDRTSGWLAIKNPNGYWPNLKYTGKTIAQLNQENPGTVPVINNVAYLTWDAQSMSWASQQPEGSQRYVTFVDPRGWTPYE